MTVDWLSGRSSIAQSGLALLTGWLVGLELVAAVGCNSVLGTQSHQLAAQTNRGGAGGESADLATGPTDSGSDAAFCVDCTVGVARCNGALAQICRTVDACTQWVTSATCGANQTCSLSDAGESCTCKASPCTKEGAVCQSSDTVATCNKDSDGCYYVSATSTCTAPTSCASVDGGVSCSLSCTDTCSRGQTSCIQGQGLATCTLGPNGCWAYGAPTPCGTRQDCSGSAGVGACICQLDPVCAAAGSVCTSTTASAVCSVDAQGCFYKSSATTCANRTCVSGSCAGACTSGQAGCTGPSAATPETCGTTGQWNVGTVTANQCGAVCNPGASQCNGATPQTCSSVGQWVSGAITAKVCGAACTPGTSPAQCSGLTPQTCGADGKWQNGATCPFVCSAGACTGACSPGDTQCCNENTGVCGGGADSNAYNVIAQTCNSAGQWSTAQCGHVCSGNLAACSTNCGAVATCAVVISPGECGCP